VPSSFFQGVYFGLVIDAAFVRVAYTRQYRKTAIAEDHRTVADALLTSLPALGMFVLPLIYVLTPSDTLAGLRRLSPAQLGWLDWRSALCGVALVAVEISRRPGRTAEGGLTHQPNI